MTTDNEQDDGTLTRSVRRFRRVARRAGIDPSRMLATDPLARLEALAAPIAALIEVAAFERLREVLASNAAAASGSSLRNPVQPSVRISSGPAQFREMPALPHRSAGVATTQTVTPHRAAHHSPGLVPGLAVTSHHALPQHPGGETAPAATLAQRRAELRRRLAGQGAGSPPPLLPPIAAPAGHKGGSPPIWSTTGALGPGARAGDVAQLLQQRMSHNVPAGTRTIGDSMRQPATAAVPLPEIPRRESYGATAAGINGAVTLAEDAAIPTTAPNRLPHAGPPTDAVLRPVRADTPIGETARSPRSWDRTAGLEITDDLFEALYRNGVDFSWP
jgi:hypothetical protein